MDKIFKFVKKIRRRNWQFKEFDQVIDWILSYNLTDSSEVDSITLNSIISEIDPLDWNTYLHKLGIHTAFIPPKEQTLDELIESIMKINSENDEIRRYARKLKAEVLKIKDLSKSKIINTDRPISEWERNDILNWWSAFKAYDNKSKNSIIREAISVIMRGNKLLHDYFPRFTQIITILIMMKWSNSGLLMQVATGEGKSLILVNIRIEYVYLHCPTVFQILIVLFILPEVIGLLPAENEHDKTSFSWSKKVTVFCPISKSHNLSVLSHDRKSICLFNLGYLLLAQSLCFFLKWMD